MPRRYKSLVAQTLHYFSRPHERVRRDPLDVPAAWIGSDFADPRSYRTVLDTGQIAEIERALEWARATGKSLGAMTRHDFPLPMLAGEIARWRREIASGRGFVLLSGLPVERWGQPATEMFFWSLGQHLGTPGAQNPDGDLLGHVVDTGANAEDPAVRAYRTRANISYHCDAADVVGLLCLRKAKRGGLSRIVSSVSVYNELLRRRPDLIELLYRPFLLDTHGEGGVDYFPIPPCRYADGRLRTFYHADYFRSVVVNARLPPLPARTHELLDLYDEIAMSPELYLDMDFEPGDIQLLSNHVVLHARTEYEEHVEPDKKRHLLRLWLSLPEKRSAKYRVLATMSAIRLARSLVVLKARRATRSRAVRI